MLFMVSEPTLFRLPDTPLAREYAGSPESTWSACAPRMTPPLRTAAAVMADRFMCVPRLSISRK